MLVSSLNPVDDGFLPPKRLLLHALTYTVLLILTVALASFATETAFVSAISPSFLVRPGSGVGLVRVPLDLPGEGVLLPAHMVKESSLDFVVRTIFAGLVVVGSAFVVRSLGLWDTESG